MEHNVEFYPLTHPQRGIWYTEKMYPGTSIGNIAATLKIKDKLDLNLLKKAINILIQNHDAFRLHFKEIDGEPVQYLTDYRYHDIDFLDFSNEGLEALYNWDSQQTQKPFDLIDSDLYYFAILKINKEEFGIYSKVHHLISDGWSIVQTGNCAVDYYDRLKNNTEIENSVQNSYKDYITSEKLYIASDRISKDKLFWEEQLSQLNEITSLKVDTLDKDIKAKRRTFIIPGKFSELIRRYCRENNTSIFSLFMCALGIYINRITSKEDIIIGVPVINRSNAREKETFGMFVSTVPLRVRIDNTKDFKTFSNELNARWFSVLKHQKYPYEMILRNVRENNGSIDKLYDISLSYQNAKFVRNNSLKHEGRWHFNGYQTESLYLHINDREDDGNIIIDMDYNLKLFKSKEIEFIYDHICRLLWHALDNPNKPVCKLDMVSEREKKKILYEFNDTDTPYPDKTIIELFEEQVRISPDAVAVKYDRNNLTYRSFNIKVNELAWRMIETGVKPGDVVAVLMNRSFNALLSIYAVLKCGATFLTIDPSYPTERIQYIIEDSSPKMILHDETLTNNEISFSGPWMFVSGLLSIKKDNPGIRMDGGSLAYIIYTSGSTGMPKGAMITNKGLVNYIVWANKVYTNGNNATFPLYSSLSFDLTITSVFAPLISGGSIVIYEEDKKCMPILKVFKDNLVDIVKLTPAHLNLIKDLDNSGSRIKKLIVGGEELKTELARQVYKSFNGDIEIFNEYGPTETVVGCMIYKFDYHRDNRASVPIGVPADNVRLYILDKFMNPVPIGIPGELYIGGDGVCAGYLNRPELTAEKFVASPFSETDRIYKSGDLARWFPKGDVEYLGRIDYQVKIKGFRIELGEIENRLISHEHVKEAVVIDINDNLNNKALCAYIVTDETLDSFELRSYLLNKLPAYMIPAYFVRLDAIPLTNNGKVDRNKLPKPEKSVADAEYTAPSNKTEEMLELTVKSVLGLEKISVNDNFFHFGIDSLMIVRIQAKLLSFNWNLSTQDFYEYPTIKLLAAKIINAEKSVSGLDAEIMNFKSVSLHNDHALSTGNVLLTGVTGFLGIHLLTELIKNTDSNIYCLVRESSKDRAMLKLIETLKYYFGNDYNKYINNRIIVVCGDFTVSNFGLSENDYTALGNSVKTIIHSGALVKHYGNVDLFRKTNVIGTEEVIRFALRFNIQLNHISTMSIAGEYTNRSENMYEFNETDLFIGQDFESNIYLKTKFNAEELIVKNIRQNNLNANIFRVGNLTGRYSDGFFQRNRNDNMFYNRVYFISNLGMVPENITDMEVDLTPVDYCSNAIINIIKNYRNKSDIYHIVNNNKIKLIKLVRLLNSIGYDIRIVSWETFQNYAKKFYEKNYELGYLSSFVNEFHNGFNLRSNVIANYDKTLKELSDISFSWPICNVDYIKRIYSDINIDNDKDVV